MCFHEGWRIDYGSILHILCELYAIMSQRPAKGMYWTVEGDPQVRREGWDCAQWNSKCFHYQEVPQQELLSHILMSVCVMSYWVPKDITALYICQTALDNSNRVKITSGCLCFFLNHMLLKCPKLVSIFPLSTALVDHRFVVSRFTKSRSCNAISRKVKLHPCPRARSGLSLHSLHQQQYGFAAP